MPKSKSDPDKLSFQCVNCKAKLKVKMELAGRYINCPKCQKRIPVPASQEEADEDQRDYGVKQMAYEVPKRCSKCDARMPKGAVFCTKCGFDYRKGRQTEMEDHTLKEGEPTRGKLALKYMICEIILAIVGVIWLFIRGREALWYELGATAGIIVYLLFAAIAHFRQWFDYHDLPIRESPTRQDEDRAEREEARDPLGKQTKAIVFLFVAGGVGLGYVAHPWLFPDEVIIVNAPRPDPNAVAGPVVQRPARPADVDPQLSEYLMTELEIGDFMNALRAGDYLRAYSRTSESFRKHMSAAEFASAFKKVFQDNKYLLIYLDVIALKPPRLTDPDYIYSEKLPAAERSQRVLAEGGAPSAEVPVEQRLSWSHLELAKDEDTDNKKIEFRLYLLMVRDGERARIAYFQLRSIDDPHPFASQ